MTTFVSFGPQWVFADNARQSKAHLVATMRADRQSGEGWCGFVLDMSKPAPYGERCKLCLKKLAEYAAEAAIPVPEMVTEAVTVRVTRPATSTPLADVLALTLARRTTYSDAAIIGPFP
jgi:hypothetical protein